MRLLKLWMISRKNHLKMKLWICWKKTQLKLNLLMKIPKLKTKYHYHHHRYQKLIMMLKFTITNVNAEITLNLENLRNHGIMEVHMIVNIVENLFHNLEL